MRYPKRVKFKTPEQKISGTFSLVGFYYGYAINLPAAKPAYITRDCRRFVSWCYGEINEDMPAENLYVDIIIPPDEYIIFNFPDGWFVTIGEVFDLEEGESIRSPFRIDEDGRIMLTMEKKNEDSAIIETWHKTTGSSGYGRFGDVYVKINRNVYSVDLYGNVSFIEKREREVV